MEEEIAEQDDKERKLAGGKAKKRFQGQKSEHLETKEFSANALENRQQTYSWSLAVLQRNSQREIINDGKLT